MKTNIALAVVALMTVGCATTAPSPAPQVRVDRTYQATPTVHYGERTKGTVIEVKPVYEMIVVGKNCNPNGERVICSPLTQPKQTANSYVAEWQGRKFSGTTYRPLRVGDQVYVDVVVSLNVAE